MADIGALDDLGKEEIILKYNLEINRMKMSIEENEFKIFSMKKDIKRLEDSMEISKETIASKEAELTQFKEEWGIA